MADYFSFIFFSGDFSLSYAERVLNGAGLAFGKQNDQLAIRWNNGPEIRVLLDRGSWVQVEAIEIGACSPYAAALSKCGARFEIAFDSLDEVLDEINSLIEVEISLQEATQGFLFNSWNGELSAGNGSHTRRS